MMSFGTIMTEILVIIFFSYVLWGLIKMLVYRMADNDILFTNIGEGEAAAIMTGRRLKKIIMNLQGYHLDRDYNVVLGEEEETDFVNKIFPGVYWLGLPGVATVYEYPFSWVKLDEKGEPEVRKETIKQIYVKSYQYVLELKNAETSSMATLSMKVLVTFRVVNPYRALFKNDKWLALASSSILDRTRTFVSSFDDPDEIIKIAQKEDSSILSKVMTDILVKEGIIENIENFQGAKALKIDIVDIDYGDWSDMAIAEIKAKKEGDALVELASKKADALKISSKAEAKAYARLVNEMGMEFIIAIKFIEALQAAAKAGTNTIFDTGMINNLLTTIKDKGLDEASVMRDINILASKVIPAKFEEMK